MAWLLAAWLVAPPDLAAWMEHPVRLDGAAASLQGAAWARWGWTAGGLTLLFMPWLLGRQGATWAVKISARERGLLILAMVGAVVLRFFLAGQGLWYDEIASAMTYVVHGPGVIVGNAFTTANHPLQSLLSWCSLPLGVEPWIRLPSMLSGAFTVLGCWWIGRATAPGSSLAAWCAAIAAVLPAAVNAGAEARGYGLMITCSAWATALAIEGLRSDGRARWCLYAVVLSLGVWAHFVTALVGMGHAAVAGFMILRGQGRPEASRLLGAVACAAVLALALWSPALPDLLRGRSQFSASADETPSLLGTQGWLLLWQCVGMTPLPLGPSGIRVAVAVACGLLPLAVIVAGLRACMGDRACRTALALAGLGVPIAITCAWAADSWLYARFLLLGAPATVLLLATGARSLVEGRSGSRRMAGLLATGALSAIFLGFILASPSRQPLREAVAQVAQARQPDEPVLGIGIADDVVQWYALAYGVPIEPTGVGGDRLLEMLDRTGATWIVALYPDHRHPAASGPALSNLGFSRCPTHGLPGWLDGGEGTVEVWRRNPSP
jgi:hypothetical protein